MKTRVVLDLIDADGCVYNHYYQDVLAWLKNKYSETVGYLYSEWIQEQVTGIINPDIQKIIQSIKQEISALDIKSIKHSALINYLLWDAKQATELIEMLNDIDESIMQLIFVKSNEQLLNFLKHENEHYDLQSVGIGSARQSYKNDVRGAVRNGTGRIFNDVFHLVKMLRKGSRENQNHIELKSLTTPDIGCSLPSGENYKRIMTNYNGQQASFPNERSKIPIVYAMSQDMACQYREADITIHFYDNDIFIIGWLKSIFKRYPELLPTQATLELHRYNGEFLETTVIKGTGPVDENYHHNVTRMMEMAKQKQGEKASRMLNAGRDVNFKDFIATRICEKEHKKSSHDIRFSTMFSTQKTNAESEFEDLADNQRRLLHTGHRESARLFALAAPCKHSLQDQTPPKARF
jgi:hypothetical protein